MKLPIEPLLYFLLSREPFVGLIGLDLGLALTVPINKTLTASPFGNNLHSAGLVLTPISIWGC